MFSKRGKTKTASVTDTLRESIRNDEFSDGMLPSKLELASHFKVSHRTVELALKTLKDEGLIRGVRGTGIFINHEPKSVSNLTQRLLLQISPRDNLHESEPYQTLRREAFTRGYFPVHLPLLIGSDKYRATLSERASMTQLLRAPIQGVIFDGRSYWREPFLQNFKNIRSVAIINFDADCEVPHSGVLTDYVHGGRIQAQHMIENGARRLALLFSWIAPDVPKSKSYWYNHPSYQCLRGAKEITDAAGLPPPELFFIQSLNENDEVNYRHLAAYDGVICCSDGLAFHLMNFMEKIGKKVPQDILIAGQQETIWSYGLGKQITTFNLNPEELSKQAIDMLESGRKSTVYVKPVLVVRATTSR